MSLLFFTILLVLSVLFLGFVVNAYRKIFCSILSDEEQETLRQSDDFNSRAATENVALQSFAQFVDHHRFK